MSLDFKPVANKAVSRRLSLIKEDRQEDFRLVGELYWDVLSTDDLRDLLHEVVWQGVWAWLENQ